ncbi:ATP-binding cassette domain-containing protein [Penaeicola halotolerans]|uniref:ATP-binding cassette domain-containing protein n=1 Tax=Penaeicola halotolerans TaxID=2793196 RepID=UPI001CF88C47|nr:ATP-binding cassette domain-containing protein [Penaeicola halotolerans]
MYTKQTLIEARGLGKSTAHLQHDLKGVNLTLQEGDFLVISGAEGAGKSSLLSLLSLLEIPDQGKLLFLGRDVTTYSEDELARFRSQYFGYVFQNFNLISGLTLSQNIEIPLVYSGLPLSQRVDRVKEVLECFKIAHKADEQVSNLTVDHLVKASLARAIVHKPQILIIDEPFEKLSWAEINFVRDSLVKLNEEGMTILLTAHTASDTLMANKKLHLFDGMQVPGETSF